MCLSEIAVMLGDDKRTIPAGEPATIVVFCRERREWKRDREYTFRLDENGGLAGLRTSMAGLLAFLGDCRVVVAKSASGGVFFELERARCTVFEIAGTPEEFLNTVWREMKEEQEAQAPLPAGIDIPAPLEIVPGRFAISIMEIQQKRPELSSKQVLREFVRRGEFAELEIRCDHIPPWLEADAGALGYELQSDRIGMHEVRVLVRNERGGCC